jgi:hypothetical protein
MDLPDSTLLRNGAQRLPLDIPPRAMIAFDQLTGGEKDAVLAALQVLERTSTPAPSTADATRLSGSEPLYLLRPAPNVRVIVRAGAGEPIEVLHIVRSSPLRNRAPA